MNNVIEITEQTVWEKLESVKDPEIPVISIIDMGMITNVEIHEKEIFISLTPTFTACPAINYISEEIKKQVRTISEGKSVVVKIDTSVAWNSNRITTKGKKILKDFGLAPPTKHNGCIDLNMLQHVQCPHCESTDTVLKNPFGPTLCRAIHYCNNCQQAFQQFKPI